MAIVAQVTTSVKTALINVAAAAADRLTPILRNMAIAAGWPSDVVLSLTVKADKGALYIDYPEDLSDQINDLEYGEIDQAPSAVLRPFATRFASHLEDLASDAVVDVLADMEVFN